MLYAERGHATVCRLSVCLSVCPSVLSQSPLNQLGGLEERCLMPCTVKDKNAEFDIVRFCISFLPSFFLHAGIGRPSSSFHPFPKELIPLSQLGSLGSTVSSPSRVRDRAPVENEFGALQAVRKPLVAVILNILTSVFYSRKIKI